MAAVVAFSYGYSFRDQVGHQGVQGGEARGVSYARCLEERGKDCLEAGCAVGCEAGVAMLGRVFLEREVRGIRTSVLAKWSKLRRVGGVAKGGADVDRWCYVAELGVQWVVSVDGQRGGA